MAATEIKVQMQQRRDTAAGWTSANPALLSGELGYETDTGKFKIGDGTTAWASLGYIAGLSISSYPLATADIADDAVTGDKLANDITIANDLTVTNNLTVNGTTTTINSTTLQVDDKNIELGTVATPTDITADGGGITLKGTTDHTILWTDSTDSWDLSEHVNIASGKEFRIAGTKVLDATSLGSGVLITSANITDGTIVDADISTSAEIAVSKLANGTARQLLQTDAAGTGVEFTSNVDVPGTLDVTGAATLDSTLTVTGVINADGKVKFPAGTAAAPSFYSGTDTDTGLYFSAADEVSVTTGGTQRLKIKSDGGFDFNTSIAFASNGYAKFDRRPDSGYGFSSFNVSSRAFQIQDSSAVLKTYFGFDGSASFAGAVSKGSGSFRIDHPLKPQTHQLVHSFVEAPDASNLYAGMVDLVDGTATVNIDTAHRMTEGTFEALNHLQSWSSSNESGYAPVKCSVSGNLLMIECQDPTSTDTVYYEVRGIRKDQHMLETDWTDDNGKVIVEPLKPTEPDPLEEL